MILVLFRNGETERHLSSAPASVLLHPIEQLEMLAEFQRRSVRVALCEWDSGMPPAEWFRRALPEACQATFAAQFELQTIEDSRRKGFAAHFFLPLPPNFFKELQKSPFPLPPPRPLAPAIRVVQLLERQRDYVGLCSYAAEAFGESLPAAGWSVSLLDKEMHWSTVFASTSWSVTSGQLAARLPSIAGGHTTAPITRDCLPPADIACLPLLQDGALRGALCWHGDPIRPVSAEPFEELAVFLTSAIHQVDMLAEKERLTFADTLTGLRNLHYLRQFLIGEIPRCLRYKKSVSVLFIDIDWFKQVNDNHGHMAGSDALVEIGRQFSSVVRESDVVVRYGGDEFVIVLTETGPTDAAAIAERIRKSVESHIFGTDKGRSIRVTVSIGVSAYPDHGMTGDELVSKADGAMYQAKHLQRNRVRVAA
jgi:diguanylate cyclase (GGDEF)-like protein